MDFAQRFPRIFSRKASDAALHEAAPGEVEHDMPEGMPLHGSYGNGEPPEKGKIHRAVGIRV